MLKKSTASLILLLISLQLFAQKNQTQESNYKVRTDAGVMFWTKYDNGYVVLLDSTVFNGQISLKGPSYNEVASVSIRTNAGSKYTLDISSLQSYGLAGGMINDTPGKFNWSDPKKSAFREVRTGYASFGYLVTNDGKRYEGKINLKEINGKIESIKVENDSFDPSDVTNFGTQEFIDPKFVGPWTLLSWSYNMTGSLVSKELQGFVELTNGSKEEGALSIRRSGADISRIFLEPSGGGKKLKLKYDEVKSYGASFSIEQAFKARVGDRSREKVPPRRRFYPGKVTMSDGTEREGILARRAISDIADVYFAENESSPVEFIDSQSIEDIEQQIPDEEQRAYDAYVYEITHVKGYEIQNPPQWEYVSQGEGTYLTEEQPGYIKKDGEAYIGTISVRKWASGPREVTFQKPGENNKIKSGISEYGLIEFTSSSPFPSALYLKDRKKLLAQRTKTFEGFVQPVGYEKPLEGLITIKTLLGDKDNTITFILEEGGEKTKFDEVSVYRYGFKDLPMSELMKYYSTIDAKEEFQPGSFNYKGEMKKGYIAYTRKNEGGTYEAILFAEKPDGVVNAYYLDNPDVSDVVQTVTESTVVSVPVETQVDELDDESLQTFSGSGFVITADTEKIEGTITVSFPNNRWFATEIIVEQPNGTKTTFANDGSLIKAVFDSNGSQKEFYNYEGDYVEVYSRAGSMIYFRDPHPTEKSFAKELGDIGSFFKGLTGERYKNLEKVLIEEGKNRAVVGPNGEVQYTGNKTSAQNFVDYNQYWNNLNLKSAFEKTMIILDEITYEKILANQGENLYGLINVLKGCGEYYELDNAEQRALYSMENPERTLRFLITNLKN